MRGIPAGILLGVGLGGFADGIALHQIAQWHNMGSAVLPPASGASVVAPSVRWRLGRSWSGRPSPATG